MGYSDLDLNLSLEPDSQKEVAMKVAFTSKTGEMIDQHFGMTDSFHIWEIGPDEAHYLETVSGGSARR